ncbi:MAG: alpha/beta fold hydrolase [Myxococcota bacterium]|nr:alpha/beta fold hydrolase [Myxococcota bacterium]
MRSDFDRAAVRRAIAREALAYLTHALLYPFGRRTAGPPPRRDASLRTLVFVHGLAANRSSFLALQTVLRLAGHRRQVAVSFPTRGSIESLALALRRELERRIGGGRIDLVAHSMGGLVARFYLQQLGGTRRVDRLVTLGTPHRGTHAASFLPLPLVRQLLPDGPFIRHLNALPPPARTRVTSIVAGRDLLVQPVESAACPFGEVRRLDELGHLELLFRPEVFVEVVSALRAG